MEERQLAISAEQITKVYKLYDKPSDRLKEALGLKRGKLHKEHYRICKYFAGCIIYHDRNHHVHQCVRTYKRDWGTTCNWGI